MKRTESISAIRRERVRDKVIFFLRGLSFMAIFCSALYIAGSENMPDEEFWTHAVEGIIVMLISALLYAVLTFMEAYYAGDFD